MVDHELNALRALNDYAKKGKKEDLGRALFGYHTHGDITNPLEIVYREEDVIKLVKMAIQAGKDNYDKI